MTKPSLQLNLPPAEVKTADRLGYLTSAPVNCLDRDWLGLVTQALGRAGISHKAAAVDMGIDAGLLSAQLSGTKHLSWGRLGKLPAEFWQDALPLMAEYHGVPFGRDAELGAKVREVFALLAVRP